MLLNKMLINFINLKVIKVFKFEIKSNCEIIQFVIYNLNIKSEWFNLVE